MWHVEGYSTELKQTVLADLYGFGQDEAEAARPYVVQVLGLDDAQTNLTWTDTNIPTPPPPIVLLYVITYGYLFTLTVCDPDKVLMYRYGVTFDNLKWAMLDIATYLASVFDD